MCKHFVALGWASVCLQWLLVLPNAAAESGNNEMSNTTIKSDTNSVQNIAATQVDNTSTNANDNNSTGNISRSNNNNNNNDNHNHSNPHFKSNRTTIVHLFEWKFLDVAEECINFLGPNGYAGVQLSPVTEHLVVRTARYSHPWWERYQPISYKIATRSGSEDEFLKMTRACNAVGVRIYVDVVLNHMAANKYNPTDSSHRNTSNTKDKTNESNGTFPLLGNAGSKANANTFDYPSVPYKVKDFHKACMLENYQDAHEVRNCQLDGQPDLDHSIANVQVRIVEFLNKLVDLGVAGFRVDAAKHMWPIDIKHMVNNVKNLNSEDFDFAMGARPFLYLDVADVGLDAVSK
ncbi:alpha-amylase 1-like [Teleopsis dalmanni]|uniref:alpha-amylase 1-like n=1 Tax=Teleopsis dalmanni TaxID=139649 RepID=UPI0018CF7080|nr:alpha-amylase 1-like [Teleopsis dalmanni]